MHFFHAKLSITPCSKCTVHAVSPCSTPCQFYDQACVKTCSCYSFPEQPRQIAATMCKSAEWLLQAFSSLMQMLRLVLFDNALSGTLPDSWIGMASAWNSSDIPDQVGCCCGQAVKVTYQHIPTSGCLSAGGHQDVTLHLLLSWLVR